MNWRFTNLEKPERKRIWFFCPDVVPQRYVAWLSYRRCPTFQGSREDGGLVLVLGYL